MSGYSPEPLFVDKVSEKVPFLECPQAAKHFDEMTSDSSQSQALVIDSVDRLGRSLINILETIELFSNNNFNIKSIKEGFETLQNGKENPLARMTLSLIGSIAEFERGRLKQRQAEGRTFAKARGKYVGRKVGGVMSDTRLLERQPIIVEKLKKN